MNLKLRKTYQMQSFLNLPLNHIATYQKEIIHSMQGP